MEQTLGDLYNKHECDKARKHSYDLIYERYFAPVRKEPLKILELGVYKGASVRAHLDYFPNATVHGVDIFERVPLGEVKTDEERSALFQGSSTDSDMVSRIRKEFKNIKYDFIIDDAQHTPEANRKTFQVFSRMLTTRGVYFIEDIWALDKMSDSQKNHYWLQRHKNDFTQEKYAEFLDALKEYDVTRFDHRIISGEPDSYVMAIERP